MAVFLISSARIGIWWYPCFKSSLLKTLHPLSPAAKSSMWGSGYLPGSVIKFRRWKTQQCRQDPSGFFTICRGDAQQLLDLLTIPCCSMSSKAAFATACIAGSRRRNQAVTGLPIVGK